MKRFLTGCASAFLLALPALAQETEKQAAAEPSQIWVWLNFLILVAGLGYLIAKNLGPFLTARTAEIQAGMKAGEKAKAEADARAAAVQAQLNTLGAQIEKLRASALDDRSREVARIGRETEAELNRIQQHAALEIESAGKMAQLEVRRFAAKAAIELAEQKVRASMSSDVQGGLIRNFLGDLATGASQPNGSGPRTT